jgi:two-component system NtrC family sensor kinase
VDDRYRQLQWRVTLFGLAVTLIPLWLLGTAIYLYFASAVEQSQRSQLHALALNRTAAIQLFLDERVSTLEVLAHTAHLDELTAPGELRNVLDILNVSQHSFVDLGIIDANGEHLAYEGPFPLEDRNYGGEQWFEETLQRGVHISDVFLGFRGVPHFVIAIRREDRPEPWILRVTIDFEVFIRLVRSGQVGLTGDAYIVNRSGLFQTPPRFGGSILERAPFNTNIAPPGVNVVFRQTRDQGRVMTAFAWVTSKDWLLVIDRDPSEPEIPLKQTLRIELIALIATSLLVGGAVVFHVRQLVTRLATEDEKRVRTEAQLAHSARLVSLGRMAAGVAHEINNPLAVIGELAGLMEDLIDPEFVTTSPHGELFRENVTKIQRHVDRTREITHRLLGFARRMEPQHDNVNINEVTREALSFIENEASFRQVELVQQLDPDLPIIKSDQAQLQQVILNLLNNALDASSPGGRVVVSTAADADTVTIEVEDAGSGISDEIKERIFDPFFTTKGPGEGSGLGLSICHTITKGLGGSLTFDSEAGKGTTFRVRLSRIQE